MGRPEGGGGGGAATTRMISFSSFVFLLTLLDLSHCGMDNCDYEEKHASTLVTKNYATPGYPSFSSFSVGYARNMCFEVKFEASYKKDGVEISIKKTDLPPRDIYGECGLDKITFHDGETANSPVLATVCGNEIQTLESSGHVMLMVFEAGRKHGKTYKGMKLTYKGIDRGGFDQNSVETPVSKIVWMTLASAFGSTVTFVFIFCMCRRRRLNNGTIFSRNPQVLTTPGYSVQHIHIPPNQAYAPGPTQGYSPGLTQGYPSAQPYSAQAYPPPATQYGFAQPFWSQNDSQPSDLPPSYMDVTGGSYTYSKPPYAS